MWLKAESKEELYLHKETESGKLVHSDGVRDVALKGSGKTTVDTTYGIKMSDQS